MIEDNLTVKKLKEKFPDHILDVGEFRDQVYIYVQKNGIIEVLRFLRDEEELAYDFLADLTAVDNLGKEPRFEVVYNLYSIKYKRRFRVKVPLGEDEPIDSCAEVWKTANWHERECFDMFGIRFEGHPDLRRILMPDDYPWHPLRKDFPLQGPEDVDYEEMMKKHLKSD
jgi:NADH-quinone oxidoreductase subunit C